VCNYDGCDKAYFQEKHLQAHIKGSHTHERSFVCDWEGCGKSFLTSTRLKRHNDTHIGHERFRCTAYPPCNQTFRKHQTLQRHINSEHLELAPYQCHYIDPITNRACSAGFDGANGLRQHVERIHGTPRFFCPDCLVPGQFDMNQAPMHLGFVTEKAFQAHVRKEHANCAFCELKCRSQRELQKHIETLHSGSTLEERKNIPCTYAGCDRRFTKKNNLTAHIRTAHMGERFICGNFDVSSYPDLSQFDDDDGCGSDFVSKQYLVDHIRTSHLGLPSVLNANRKKASSISDIETDDGDEYIAEDFSDGEEEQYSEPKRTTKRASKAKSKSSTIDDLIGVSYENDPKRKTPCPVLNCPYRFIRNYDLQVHLRTSHQDWVPTFETPFPPSFNTDTSFQYPEPSMDTYVMGPECSYAEASMSNFIEPNADIEWELQRQAMEGGAFWVGSDDSPSKDYVDQEWTQEVEEMRRLIG
jgi:general transcription factor IIIA